MMTYAQYWRFSEAPFQNVADARFAFLSDQHQEGLARLVYLVENRKLGGVLTGPYGVGKSMVLYLLAQQMRSAGNVHMVELDYLPGDGLSLARQILAATGHLPDAADLHTAMRHLRGLREALGAAEHVVISIDEAQMITDVVVYQVLHLIMNMTLPGNPGSAPRSAFTLLLAGHSDVTRILGQDTSLCQRMQLVWQLEPLSARQTVDYIRHRLTAVGGDLAIFDPESLQVVYDRSRGIPRLINSLCDIALMLGCASGAGRVDRNLALQASEDAAFCVRHDSCAPTT